MKNKAAIMRQTFNDLACKGNRMLRMPVAGDGLSAKNGEKAGFKAINVTGLAVNSVYGKPNWGFADFYILFNQAKEIVDSVNIPVLCDVGTGHGFSANIARTIRSYEAIGAAGIYIDDGVWPKACGDMAATLIVPEAEMTQRIRAAVEARTHADFTIMAHSSARAVCNLDQAIAKYRSYVMAGADMLYVDSITSVDDLRKIAQKVPNVPLLANLNLLTQPVDAKELLALGYSLTTLSDDALHARVAAEQASLAKEKDAGAMENSSAANDQRERLEQLVDTEQMRRLESAYAK
ncbi:hypothetical protein EQ500_03115 [Lactobacillus sp. XV13L]|nr:hypothetical protein [Lactobacillus sp. XV13L]